LRVLVVGHERSATTWTGEVLGAAAHTGYVNEPDDPRMNPFSIRAMAGLGTLPVLRADDPATPDLVKIWDAAYGIRLPRYVRGQHRASVALLHGASADAKDEMESTARRLTPRLRLAAALGVPRHLDPTVERANIVVKSVRAPFMLDWIRARWDPSVVVCFRHPLDVVASVLAAGNVGRSATAVFRRLPRDAREVGTDRYGVPFPTRDDRVEAIAWRVGLVMSYLEDECRAHPEFHVVEHARICEDPSVRLRELVAAVGLTWSEDTEAFVTGSNREGTTWETSRVASEQRDRWRSRLTPEQAQAASRIISGFPIAARYEDDLVV
jgi:hypothetical protein